MGHFVNPSPAPTVHLSRIEGELVIAKLDPAEPVPTKLFAEDAPVLSITRTSTEVSIVCPRALAPNGAEVDGPWAAWYIQGPIPFSLTGVVHAVVSPLSARAIPVFVVSTFDSDLIMAPVARAEDAAAALREAGHVLA